MDNYRLNYFRIFMLTTLVFCMASLSLHAQHLEWNVNLHGFADNREFARSGSYSQTIFGVRFSPEIGLLIDSTHRVRAGVNFIQEFGARKNDKQFEPVIYYNYQQRGLDFYMGLFPRFQLLDDYPRAILNDTLLYYRPNIEGMLLRYAGKSVLQQIWIDWTSRQTATDREQFMVGLSGKVEAASFYFSHYAMLWHNARARDDDEGQAIRDNGAIMASIGMDLSHRDVFLDSIDFNVGGILAIDRLRGQYGWRTPKGFIANAYFSHKQFFLQNTFYTGESLDIPYGDRFYTAPLYNRLGLGWIPLRYGQLEGKFIVSFHFTRGAIDNQQQFLLRYKIGRSHKLKAF
ncbi:hypothetical protein [Parapedobacter tibetensis]|uniref:hypothetical protein n=1 Tax=Parapedobacter tibetensis TaxID=2972951 RepID=UPI00214D59C2|nr:hypothetical protein [Parapedobacter tibetensis]